MANAFVKSQSTPVFDVDMKDGFNFNELDRYISAQKDSQVKFFKKDNEKLILSQKPIILKKPIISYQPQSLAVLGYETYVNLGEFNAGIKRIPFYQLVDNSTLYFSPLPSIINLKLPYLIQSKPIIDIVSLWKLVMFSIFVVASILWGVGLFLCMALQSRIKRSKVIIEDYPRESITEIVKKDFLLDVNSAKTVNSKGKKVEKDLI